VIDLTIKKSFLSSELTYREFAVLKLDLLSSRTQSIPPSYPENLSLMYRDKNRLEAKEKFTSFAMEIWLLI